VADAELEQTWARTKAHLEAARGVLPRAEAPGVDDYRNYLTHNELGLAFDVLVEVGSAEQARQRFWQIMQDAATEMNLTTDDSIHGHSVSTVQESVAKPDRYPCPCCGHLVFREQPGCDDICPVCFWEDDLVQLRWPDLAGGANRPSLIKAQENYRLVGASEPRLLEHVRAADSSEPLDDHWRRFDPTRDHIEERRPGIYYGKTYAIDRTAYYYWIK
jgi:hypothetical protein